MITASSSSKLKLNQSKRGYAFNPKLSPGLIPQSSITLLSGVTTIKQDLPTCFTPPRQKSITSSLFDERYLGFPVGGSMAVTWCEPFPFPLLPTTSEPLKIRLPNL